MTTVSAARLRRIAILGLYTALFGGLLPWALVQLGLHLDATRGWSMAPSPWGWSFVLPGAVVVVWSIAVLHREGGGLPVSALPPPRLTAAGPYTVVRHPIYLGFKLTVAGVGLLLGSRGLTLVVAPLLLPAWVVYALLEERALVRRFGRRYLRYRSRVGLLPAPDWYRLAQLVFAAGALPVRATGTEHLPRRGPAVLVANHSCYLDAFILGGRIRRRIRFLATAEAFRGGLMGWGIRRLSTVPVRRYRQDVRACREMVRLLEEGEVVGIFPESERSILGNYQGALDDVAGIVARLPCPVVPVGISGAYDIGPRWADVMRRRRVTVRFGPPIVWGDEPPGVVLDEAISRLLESDPQGVGMDGLDRSLLHRILWRCPRCLEADGWSAARLRCEGCGMQASPLADGGFQCGDLRITLADLARPVWEAPESAPLRAPAVAFRERSLYGPIRPLEPMGSGDLEIGPDALRFPTLTIPLPTIGTTSTERADTLQVSTRREMWQFRPQGISPFRLQRALDRWRGRPGLGGDPFLAQRRQRRCSTASANP